MLFFVDNLLSETFNTKAKGWFLTPFILHISYQTARFTLFLVRPKFLFEQLDKISQIDQFWQVSSILYSAVLLFIVIKRLTNYQNSLLNNYSSIENRTVKWLLNLIFALVGLWLLWCIPYGYELLTGHFSNTHHYPLWIGMTIIVYWIGYSSYIRSGVFEAAIITLPETKQVSKLSDKLDEYHRHLIGVLENDKPYLDPELNLEELAKKVNLSAGYLSQIINKKEGSNFYDLINKYRVEEAKKIIADPKFNHYSLLAIGQEAGFNSKTTFN
ncbi:MAG: helix-turn-helix domain-containing protein, partial [Cytophagales bacterium]